MKIHIAAAITAGVMGWAAPLAAQSELELMQMADSLGTLLASESFCDLSYDQGAIEAYMDANVPASNMRFPSDLQGATLMAEYSLEDMTDSARAAHCRAIANTARHHGFIE